MRDPAALLRQLQGARVVVPAPRKAGPIGGSIVPEKSKEGEWQKARPGESLIGMHQGVQMEKIDPMHRVYEFKIKEGKITNVTLPQEFALQEWADLVTAGKFNEPFFVFLEGTRSCVDTPNVDFHSGIQEFPAVKYFKPASALQDGVSMLTVRDGTVVECTNLTGSRPFDTEWITYKDSPKGTMDERFGRKTMAYNWTRYDELLVGLHKEAEFHHSTFTGGDLLRCAGMIGARKGKIYWIDNCSGHYRPPSQNLVAMIKALKAEGAFSEDARVMDGSHKDGSAAKSDEGVPLNDYLANPTRTGIKLGGHRPAPRKTTPWSEATATGGGEKKAAMGGHRVKKG